MARAPQFPDRDRRDAGDWPGDEPADSFPTARRRAARPRRPDRDAYAGDYASTTPRLTLPSIPLVRPGRRADAENADIGRRRTLMSATARQRAVRADHADDEDVDSGPASVRARAARRREQSSARPIVRDDAAYPGDYDEYEASSGRQRALTPYAPPAAVALDVPDVPDLALYRPARPRHYPRVDTRALVRRARSPWSLTRLVLAVASISLALFTAFTQVGEAHQPLMDAFQVTAGSHEARSIASLVQPETQMMRPDLYDSYQQFVDWGNAACSSATLSEVLTAWGVQGANIGKLIDVMQPDVSLNGGLLTPHGYQRGAAAFGYRADIKGVPGTGDPPLSYDQILHVTNDLGLPLVVNVRISWGYYHFFDGGHFLVVTGGDAQGLKIVDSSEYYIKYLSKDVFYSMFTGMTVVTVPQDYHYGV